MASFDLSGNSQQAQDRRALVDEPIRLCAEACIGMHSIAAKRLIMIAQRESACAKIAALIRVAGGNPPAFDAPDGAYWVDSVSFGTGLNEFRLYVGEAP